MPHTKLLNRCQNGGAPQKAAETTKIVVRFSYTKNNFFPYLSGRTKSIIAFRNEYNEETLMYGDDNLPFESQRRWIINFEAFSKQYPSSFEEGLQGRVQTYVMSGVEERVASAE